jgi:hypothetical protein
LKQTPLYKRYNTEIDPTFLNVDNMPEDTYEVDEINILATLNAYLPNNTCSYEKKTNTWIYLQVKTTNLLALYIMSMVKSFCFQAYTWGKPQPLRPT